MSAATVHLCRDCLAGPAAVPDGRCPRCGSPRVVSHEELGQLAIAHIDCDAFYASVEKRDHPELADRPVIVGGGRRGVVAAACYVARVYGVRSAMPMYKALEACPEAVVVRPDMAKYAAVGRQVRELMRAVTPLVEPLSIDEAFLDLTPTRSRHSGSPAHTLAKLALEIERTLGVGVSIGLSYNKFLAKIASDLDKPRGFAAIGRAEAKDFLASRPVGMIFGVGRALEARLRRGGIATIGDLQRIDEAALVRRFGSIGRRLYRFSRGQDDRKVNPDQTTKSVSSETTLAADSGDPAVLSRKLWTLSRDVARRLQRRGLSGQRVTLKLKTVEFKLLTRSCTLSAPTDRAEDIYQAAVPLLERETGREAFRLIGVGTEDLSRTGETEQPDLLDPAAGRATLSQVPPEDPPQQRGAVSSANRRGG